MSGLWRGVGVTAPARRILFLVFPGCETLDFAGPLQVFSEAVAAGANYSLQLVGPAETATSVQGLTIGNLGALPDPEPLDRVIVPGYPLSTVRIPPPVLRWLARARREGAEICSVCTGAFALGAAGLLDGRVCTTHWRRVGELQSAYREARVVGERLFVEDRGVITSAGIASGIDLALWLVERDYGPALCSQVTREMVVWVRRDGAHPQDSVYLDYQSHFHPAIHRLQHHLVTNPTSREPLHVLARHVGLSERQLTRAFRRATGVTIHEYRERIRFELARTLVRNPGMGLEAVAASCGLSNSRQLRRLFHRRTGRPPRGRDVR